LNLNGGDILKEEKYVLTYGKRYRSMPYIDHMNRFYRYIKSSRSYFVYMLYVGFIRHFHLEDEDDETIASYIQAWYGGFIDEGARNMTTPKDVRRTDAKKKQESSDFVKEDKPDKKEETNKEEENLFAAGGVFDLGSFLGKG